MIFYLKGEDLDLNRLLTLTERQRSSYLSIPSSSNALTGNTFNFSSINSDNYNIAIMGAAAVGKSSITLQFVQKQFIEEYNNTLEDKFTKNTTIDGKLCVLDILDTSGEDEFNSLRSLWMQKREGFIFVFSVDNPKSFEELNNFYSLYKITFKKYVEVFLLFFILFIILFIFIFFFFLY